jgi:hypothetical protein
VVVVTSREEILAAADLLTDEFRHLRALLRLWAATIERKPGRVAAEARLALAAIETWTPTEKSQCSMALYEWVLELASIESQKRMLST